MKTKENRMTHIYLVIVVAKPIDNMTTRSFDTEMNVYPDKISSSNNAKNAEQNIIIQQRRE